MSGYWTKFNSERLARRRMLAAGGAVPLGALALSLVGCSNDDDKPSSGTTNNKKDASGLISTPSDTSSQATKGGSFTFNATADVANFDLSTAVPGVEIPQFHVYNRLLGPVPTKGAEWDGRFGPELAESWEVSSDKLQVTLKLRNGVKWHNKPPVNARLFDAEDVMASWQRFVAKGAASAMANSVNPDAPITSFTAPDNKTIVIKTKFPASDLLAFLAQPRTSYLIIFPKEVDKTWDIRSDMLGTGPFSLSKYEKGVGYEFTRNPEYFDSSRRPHVEKVHIPIIPEYASALAQLRAGNIDYMLNLRSADVVATKRAISSLNMYATPFAVAGQFVIFGQQGRGGNKSVFLDERVRQAVSMSIDRDLYLDTFLNIAKYRSEGISVDARWNSALTLTNVSTWVLDPKSNDFGPNAKYYQYNIAEAKKLMSAAGLTGTTDVTSTYPGLTFGPDLPNQVQVLDNMIAEAGFKPTQNPVTNYPGEFIQKYRDNKGNFEGWTAHASPSYAVDALAYLMRNYYSKGGPYFFGFDSKGLGDNAGDPEVDGLLVKARNEFGVDQRRQILFDLQRLLGKKQYAITTPGGANGFALVHPQIQNYQVNTWPDFAQSQFVWVDETKRQK